MPDFSPRQRAWTRFTRSLSAWFGLAMIACFVGCALLADVVAPYDPDQPLVGGAFEQPSLSHPLGTDVLGRDVLSRTIYGARLSLLAGVVSVTIAVLLGGLAGALAGYFGGWTDTLVVRGIDVILAFPAILVAMLVVVALAPSWQAVMLAVGLINVPLFGRQVRATVLTVRELDYVVAARAMGATPLYILRRAILPSLVSPIVVLGTLALGTAILEVAGLSFLGMAGDISRPEWGNMLTTAKSNLGSSLWPALGPGVAISLAVLGFNLLGDGLRDALDPRLSGRD